MSISPINLFGEFIGHRDLCAITYGAACDCDFADDTRTLDDWLLTFSEGTLAAHLVLRLFQLSLGRPDSPAPTIQVEGIVTTAVFKASWIGHFTDSIAAMLDRLPNEFKTTGGGGWSFLNACMDRDGQQWGEHSDMERLVMLGVAAGLVQWLLPREMWSSLPGGMPYFSIGPAPDIINMDGPGN